MPATLHGMSATAMAKAAINSIIGEHGEKLTLMRAITTNRKSFVPAVHEDDSNLKKELDAFEFPNQREDQETNLAAPEIVIGVRSKIKEALEALDDAGVTYELPESVTSEMILLREQDIPQNSVFEWYDWAITHAAPNKLLLNKIAANPNHWDTFTQDYTTDEKDIALFNIENRFFSIFKSIQPLFTNYEIMKKMDMFIVDKKGINDPPAAMLYYIVPWEEPITE